MFDIDNPASSIDELYEYLSKEHTSNYCYRGQIKEYDSLVPSLYRKHIVCDKTYIDVKDNLIIVNDNYVDSKGVQHFGFLPVNPSTDDFDELRHIKLKEMRRLVSEFGGNLGNILAQQYGLSSESIDITSDLNVACFFATHKYPKYNKYDNSDEIGIIYRFKMHDTDFSFAGIEQNQKMFFDLSNPYPYLFSVNETALSEEELEELKSSYGLNKKIRGFTPYIFIDYYQIEKIFDSLVKEKNSYEFIRSQLHTTRLYRQKGGYIFPARYFNSLAPDNAKPIYFEAIHKKVMKPGFVVNENMIGIDDASKYSFVEKFYFKHNSFDKQSEDVTKEYLWPSVEEDYVFRLIASMVSIENIEYLEKNAVSFDDKDKGIIDRGYYI